MTFDKSKYKGLTYNGFVWFGHNQGIHSFSKKNKEGLYEVIKCSEEQLSNGDIEFMAKNGLSLSEIEVRKIKSKFTGI